MLWEKAWLLVLTAKSVGNVYPTILEHRKESRQLNRGRPWGLLMAASLLISLPVVILYIYGQKFMVAGLTAGSVKG